MNIFNISVNGAEVKYLCLCTEIYPDSSLIQRFTVNGAVANLHEANIVCNGRKYMCHELRRYLKSVRNKASNICYWERENNRIKYENIMVVRPDRLDLEFRGILDKSAMKSSAEYYRICSFCDFAVIDEFLVVESLLSYFDRLAVNGKDYYINIRSGLDNIVQYRLTDPEKYASIISRKNFIGETTWTFPYMIRG